jgi:hypothetical protein
MCSGREEDSKRWRMHMPFWPVPVPQRTCPELERILAEWGAPSPTQHRPKRHGSRARHCRDAHGRGWRLGRTGDWAASPQQPLEGSPVRSRPAAANATARRPAPGAGKSPRGAPAARSPQLREPIACPPWRNSPHPHRLTLVTLDGCVRKRVDRRCWGRQSGTAPAHCSRLHTLPSSLPVAEPRPLYPHALSSCQ